MDSFVSLAIVILLLAACNVHADPLVGQDYPILPVPFTQVSFEDAFWKPRLETNRSVTLPANFKKSEETGRIDNFAKAGKLKPGKHEGIFFNDSDVFKIVEGAAYTLALQYDAALDAYLDNLISLFAAAQEEDGYLYTARTIDPENGPTVIGKERWSNIKVAHELYNIGHLYEAAAAHYQATGKRTLLEVALKSADLVCSVFGPGKKYACPGHQEIEIGLVKLYRITGEQKYLDMARFFIEQRGNAEHRELFGEYCQDHKPLVEQDEAVGHSVRAGYFYAGATDVAAITDNAEYISALRRIWENMVYKKMYLTGGIGAQHQGEQFGANYELPNETAYAETCAAIASILWNQRMFLLSGDAVYIDVLERALYNGFLSGISLGGDAFFYVNPLASDRHRLFNHGAATRQPWFDCSCCPTNIVRLLPSLPGYVYAQKGDTLFVNLYVAGSAECSIESASVTLKQITNYPWEGKVQLEISPEQEKSFEMRLRIPSWAQGAPVPGDLYHYLNATSDPVYLSINDAPAEYVMDKGYACIRRTWKAGDRMVLELPMPVRMVAAHESVGENQGRVAVERGPVVYCAEWPDNEGKVYHRYLQTVHGFETRSLEILPGTAVQALVGSAHAVYRDADKEEIRSEESLLTLIPYYAWSHRGVGEMQVWLARDAEHARPQAPPTLASQAQVTASHVWHMDTTSAVNDLCEPASSKDASISRFTWWPRKGGTEWIQYTFANAAEVAGVEVYWFDDGPDGGCRIPDHCNVYYLDNEQWTPVKRAKSDKIQCDAYTRITFSPVQTDAVRLSVRMQSGFSAGILEWKVLEAR